MSARRSEPRATNVYGLLLLYERASKPMSRQDESAHIYYSVRRRAVRAAEADGWWLLGGEILATSMH